MGLINEDLKWIIDLSNDLSTDMKVLNNTIEELKEHRTDLYNIDHSNISNKKTTTGTLFLKCLFSSKWFILFNDIKFNDLVRVKINNSMTAFFIQEKSGEHSLVLFEVKKDSKTFYLRDYDILVFEKNNDFISCYEKENSTIEKHYFSINNKTKTVLHSKEHKEFFIVYFANKKIKVFKHADVGEAFAYEYNHFGKETGVLILTNEMFVNYNKQNIKDFLIFENYIYIKYKEGAKDTLVDIDLRKRYLLNENETNYTYLKEIDKSNLKDELDLWELNYKY